MAEDSGAFKTNPRNPPRFQQFVMIRKHRCSEASPGKETFSRSRTGIGGAYFSQTPGSGCGILKSA
jgi:hypothetical protein